MKAPGTPLLLIVGYSLSNPPRKRYVRYRFQVELWVLLRSQENWKQRIATFVGSALPASYYYRVFGAWLSHRGRDVASIP